MTNKSIKKKLTKLEFLDFIALRGIRVSHVLEHIVWGQDVKELTKYIEFKCEFKDGKCLRFRNADSGYSDVMRCGCCCSNCASSFGHGVVIYARHIDEYCSAWNRETGFFEKGVGCKLDRRLRSSICLSYVCDEVRKTMTELELAVLRLMHNVR